MSKEKRKALAEGLEDHDREVVEARLIKKIAYWAGQWQFPCCHDPICGYAEYAREMMLSYRAELRRYRITVDRLGRMVATGKACFKPEEGP